jgi:hypothetical protein
VTKGLMWTPYLSGEQRCILDSSCIVQSPGRFVAPVVRPLQFCSALNACQTCVICNAQHMHIQPHSKSHTSESHDMMC